MAKPNILIGGSEICGWIRCYAEGFRRNGYIVTTVVKEKERFKQDLEYDYVLKDIMPKKKWDFWKRLFFQRLHRKLIHEHDLFIFLWAGDAITTAEEDYPFIKKLGKKIITVCVGSDIRYAPATIMEFPFLKSEMSISAFREDVYTLDRFEKPLRLIEHYSDVILSVPDQSSLAIKPYYHLRVPVVLDDFVFKIHDREVPKVLHVPSNNKSKSTDFYKQIIRELQEEGLKFEPVFVENVPYRKLLEMLSDVDIMLDGLGEPGPGAQGIEAMACGTVVMVQIMDPQILSPKFHLPVISANTQNAKEKLRDIILNKSKRMSLAQEGRKWVETMNTAELVTQELIEILDGKHKPDYVPSFYTKNKATIPKTLTEYKAQMT